MLKPSNRPQTGDQLNREETKIRLRKELDELVTKTSQKGRLPADFGDALYNILKRYPKDLKVPGDLVRRIAAIPEPSEEEVSRCPEWKEANSLNGVNNVLVAIRASRNQ